MSAAGRFPYSNISQPNEASCVPIADVSEHYSVLQSTRLNYVPPKPKILQGTFDVSPVAAKDRSFFKSSAAAGECDRIAAVFPNLHGKPAVKLVKAGMPACSVNGHAAPRANGAANGAAPRQLRVGIVLSGGQAPGGHNVIAGLLDCLEQRFPGSQLLGFRDGPRGIVTKRYSEITVEAMLTYRNQGGFHMIGSGRDKIESAEDLERAAAAVTDLGLNGLVVAGGDDSNTNAAVLAEYFLARSVRCSVIGVPKTIDGDLKNDAVAISFGFDTACKVYSEAVGNIMIDAASARKYTHFVRLMGRSASHLTLETALQTHPQAALICEEITATGTTLAGVTQQVADIVAARAAVGKNYGVILIPEGLLEHVPEVSALIKELNELLAGGDVEGSSGGSSEDLTGGVSPGAVSARLTPQNRAVFDLLPAAIRGDLLRERDPHGNVQLSRIETEKLVMALVEAELAARHAAGTYAGKFAALAHYFGYEGRCALPTNFDATYCYALGYAAGALVAHRQTGLMATIGDLHKPTAEWCVGGTPLTGMMCIERRRGKDKPVVRKAMVDLGGPVFMHFAAARERWALEDCYRSPGPIQFGGGGEAYMATLTLALERNNGAPIGIF
ncbi:hypothetical protein WJX81_005636 [Elliptochloris bilobata]|uniref:Pyrophosphate--fructose 6-phosphate 1-phosphotransferase subunit beta n=1 Tax=Elliptochloris bilobata TaxID=381761 RepID=A0AAW1S0H3_9CHLO